MKGTDESLDAALKLVFANIGPDRHGLVLQESDLRAWLSSKFATLEIDKILVDVTSQGFLIRQQPYSSDERLTFLCTEKLDRYIHDPLAFIPSAKSFHDEVHYLGGTRKTYSSHRQDILGAIWLAHRVYSTSPYNLVKAYEEFPAEVPIGTLYEDDTWYDNDAENIFDEIAKDLDLIGLIDLEIERDAPFSKRYLASITELGEAYFHFFDHEKPSNRKLLPASNRQVQLDHNSRSYIDANEMLGAAYDAVRGFNGDTSYDKEVLTGELDAAKTLFSGTKVSIGAVLAVVLAPLFTAYNDVGAEVLRPIIKAAIEAIKTLIGI